MHVLHSAKRVLTAAALAVLAVGCGKDSNGPEAPFDPAGTSSDMSAVGASFESPALASFNAAADEIGLTTGGSAALALSARPTAALATGGKTSAMRYAASLAKTYAGRAPRPSLAVAQAAIPPALLGTTFVWDVSVQHYAASDLTGAPADGVRFLLYAVNPVTGIPVEPLVEIGYADVATTQTTTSASANIVVVSENVTYLDYTARITAASASTGNIAVSGYVTNGDDRVNFDLDTGVTFTQTTTQTTLDLALDYVLTVPTRGGFRIDLEADVSGALETDTGTYTLDLTARGPHGTVNIAGNATAGGGTFQVRVNGDLFATIDISAGDTAVITGKDGGALTAAEEAALEDVFHMFGAGLDFFLQLLDPSGTGF
jgi:hypothetical protein